MNRASLTAAFFVVFALGMVMALFLSNSHIGAFVTEITSKGPASSEASANVVAVSADNKGVLGNMSVEIVSGKGRVLVDTNPFLEPDTQYSAETAVQVAETLSGRSLANKDVIISFEMGGSQVVGGPSAGTAMTLAVLAALEGKRVRNDVAVTGEIHADGSITAIGGLIEKTKAAGENNMNLFLVPKGQEEFVYYEQQVTERQVGPFTAYTTHFIPKQVDLDKYAEQWDMNVRGVRDIKEAALLALVD